MERLAATVRALCAIPFITGTLDIIDGTGLLKSAGVPLEERTRRDPVLNSQVRFWGAIWLGYGIVLWRTSSHLRRDAALFKVLCGIFGLSGLARLASAIQYGLPGPVLTGAMAIELLGVGLFGWHASLLSRPNFADSNTSHDSNAD